MIYISITRKELRPAIINLVAGYLNLSKVVVLPTDTIYGLSCLATDQEAINNIYCLKKRDKNKPLIVLISSLSMLNKFVFMSREQKQLIKKYFLQDKRPTTVILRNRGLLPKELSGKFDTLAVRLPKSKFLIKIIKKLKVPLVSTSLNLSNEPGIHDLSDLSSQFPLAQKYLDLIVDAGCDRNLKPSRLIDLSNPDNPVILRA